MQNLVQEGVGNDQPRWLYGRLPEPRSTLLSVLEDAKNYEGRLQNTEPIHDQELAEFLEQLRDGSRRASERAETLLAQRLADGGVQ
jgi:hypothetical protein